MRSTALLVMILLRAITGSSENPQCNLVPKADGTIETPAPGKSCERTFATYAECWNIFGVQPEDGFNPDYAITPTELPDGKVHCKAENVKPRHFDTSLGAAFEKLSAHIKAKSNPAVAPMIYEPTEEEAGKMAHTIFVAPLAARITEVNEKDQAISVMLLATLVWTDARLRWNPSDFGGLRTIAVTRDSIWRPPIYPRSMMSFSSEEITKFNVKINHMGTIKDEVMWTFRMVVRMQFYAFPFDRQTFHINMTSSIRDLQLIGPKYILTHTQSESEWAIVEDFEEVKRGKPEELVYRVVIKRYPSFWIWLVIVPCFILGFLVVAALTLGADSNSIEALVNIGLAASVSSAVVVSTMTDHFPKTENVPSLANFVVSQFCTIVCLLITLSIRKAIMHKIDAALEAWQKTENNEELSTGTKVLVVVVKIVKHRLFLFGIFGIAYTVFFAVMMRHVDLKFDKKERTRTYGSAEHMILL